ncbi:MAG TPA: arylesterase [Cyclobacteriaceae bacterium]|jgi:acyl-CoA thioesterase-1
MTLRTHLILLLVLISSFQGFQESKTILFYGDSLTAGYGLTPEQAFPALVEKMLNSNGQQYRVVNAGVSGETSAGGLSRINWILNQHIDVFILELGANDGLRGVPLSSTKENLQGIINQVRKKYPVVKIVIAGMMVPPNMGTEYSNEFQTMFPKLANDNDTALIPFLLDGVAGDPTLNLPDGIHPNVQGHKIVAGNVMQVLQQIL